MMKNVYPCFPDIVTRKFMSNFLIMCYVCMQLDAEVIKYFSLSGKNRRLSSIFDSCWRNEVRLGQFGEVEPLCDLYEADVVIPSAMAAQICG